MILNILTKILYTFCSMQVSTMNKAHLDLPFLSEIESKRTNQCRSYELHHPLLIAM